MAARRPQHFKSVHFEQEYSPQNKNDKDDCRVKEADKINQAVDKNENGLEASYN